MLGYTWVESGSPAHPLAPDDARLIAAAPAIRAALREAFDEIASINTNQELIDRLDAALAKAGG